MILTIKHTTNYSYSEPLRESIQLLRLTPFNHHRQSIIEWHLETPGALIPFVDWFNNKSHLLNINRQIKLIEIIASGKVEVDKDKPNPEKGTLPLEYYLNHTELSNLHSGMVELSNQVKLRYQYCNTTDLGTKVSMLDYLSAQILEIVPYTRGITHSANTASEAFILGGGVCQDHTHIFIACCRLMKFPARYVSGYLYTTDESHTASHAWAEVWLNNAWYSFDISNQCRAGEHHIEMAYGLDYLDAGPIRGCRIGGGSEQITVSSLVSNNQ